MPRLEPGETVDRYVVERVLGDGGMAVVYLVKHAHLGSHHALKVLAADLLVDAGIRERFLAEGRIQAQLAHPNIARVTDVVSEPGVAALVVEYIEGPTLDEWLEEHSEGVSAKEILSIFLPVLDAVEAAHERGVLHRDLKPSNIILGKGVGGRVRPVVLDFGIAGITDAAEIAHGRKRRTKTGAQLGTPAYMSPEQVRNTGTLDERTDIFSLGAILYELATGRIAFEADSDFDTLSNVVSGTYQGPQEVPGDTRGAIGACIDKALSVRREERFASVPAFRAALKAATQGPAVAVLAEPITAEPIGNVATEEPPQPVAPMFSPDVREEPRRTSRALLWLLGLIVIVAVFWGGWVVSVGMENEARLQTVHQAEDESRSLAAAAIATLEQRQTDPLANADPAVLDKALDQARRAMAKGATAEALAAQALATVLKEGWHLRSRTWDEDAFAVVENLTRTAFSGQTLTETALARAIVEARACRLLPGRDPRRQGFCDAGEARFAELERATAKDPRPWMRVEIAWMSGGFLDALAEEREKAGDVTGARVLASKASDVCASALSAHGRGSVNDPILRSVCLTTAGRAGELGQYMRWGRVIHAAEQNSKGRLPRRTVEAVFRAAGPPSCRRLKVDSRNSWNEPFPVISSVQDRWCAVMGLYALDCPGEARLNVLAGKLGELMSGHDMPWADPEFAWQRSGALGCYLTGDPP
ncbi:MAG: protein kinase [Deltaproteobacteria bacterium]|nr:protein kinase [Deltaproteobacteria bacterium]